MSGDAAGRSACATLKLNAVAAGEGGVRPDQAGNRVHRLLHVFGANQLAGGYGLPQNVPIRRAGGGNDGDEARGERGAYRLAEVFRLLDHMDCVALVEQPPLQKPGEVRSVRRQEIGRAHV